MRFPGTRFAAAAVAMLVAAGAGCRRPPLVGESAPDAGARDARTTGEGPPQVVEAGQETMADSIAVHDSSSEPPAPDTLADVPEADVPTDRAGDAPADRSMADAPGDLTNIDTPPDIAPVPDAPLDLTPADRPADTTPEDRPSADASDVRPDEQPCGPAGWICAPYRCDVARGQCFNSCITDDQCVSERPCRANSCGFQQPGMCVANAECLSGFCAQGVCCTSACTRLCSSCAVPGQIGTCAPVANGSLEPGGRCPAGNVCDGRGECASSVCAVDTDCGRYHRCTGTRCVPCSATCVLNSDCISGSTCIDGNGCTYCGFPDAGTDGQ
jgi:hypothetical protein